MRWRSTLTCDGTRRQLTTPATHTHRAARLQPIRTRPEPATVWPQHLPPSTRIAPSLPPYLMQMVAEVDAITAGVGARVPVSVRNLRFDGPVRTWH